MTSDGARDSRQNIEPTGIEALLPWYAAGTLRRRDRARVEDALRTDPDLVKHADLVREELAETICLNESLGVPSARAMDRLMAAIDDEAQAARKRASARAVAARFANFVASFSPRTLAVAASVAVLAIALQAFMLASMFTKAPAPLQTAGLNAEASGHGTFAMVRFAREASAAEITKFLENYQATLVDGPKAGGLYRVRIAVSSLAKEEFARIVSRMRQERVVEFAGPSE
jgi:anti-sigma-K factor RskA